MSGLFLTAGLSQHNIVAAPHIYQRVSMLAPRTDEVAPLVINAWECGQEHNFQFAVFALPHGCNPPGLPASVAPPAAGADDIHDDDGTCWQCGGAGGWHDCFDDTCVCLDPDEITDICTMCHGTGVLPADDDSAVEGDGHES